MLHEITTEELTWNKLATSIAFSIQQLTFVSQKGLHGELQPKTASIVEAVRLMLYASRSMEKDSQLMQDPIFREPRRSVMSSLSKLVLSSKMGSEISEFSTSILTIFQKIQRDANDVLVAVRNFVTICQRCDITVNYVNPRLLDDITQLPFEPANFPISKTITLEDTNDKKVETNSLTQKAKFLLNQDLVLSLQAYAHQIFVSTEELSLKVTDILAKLQEKQIHFDKERTDAVSMFRTLSSQISQYIVILDDINLDNIDILQIPSIAPYRLSRQTLYTAIGHLFGAIQTLTNINIGITEAVHTIEQAIAGVEDSLQAIEQSVIAMVNERRRTMGANREEYVTMSPTVSTGLVSPTTISNIHHGSDLTLEQIESYSTNPSSYSQDGGLESDSEFGANINEDGLLSRSMRRNTTATVSSNGSNGYNSSKATELLSRRRQQSIRTDDRSFESNDTLGNDHHPDDIEFGTDNTVKGGTLSALVERLTVHDTLGNYFFG